MNKILYEYNTQYDEKAEYSLSSIDNKHTLLYGEGFTKLAKGKLAISLEDTGSNFIIKMSDGWIQDSLIKRIELDYSQAVNLLSLLLLTHKEYKFSVTCETEQLN